MHENKDNEDREVISWYLICTRWGKPKEQDEVDGIKEEADFTGKVIAIILFCYNSTS